MYNGVVWQYAHMLMRLNCDRSFLAKQDQKDMDKRTTERGRVAKRRIENHGSTHRAIVHKV